MALHISRASRQKKRITCSSAVSTISSTGFPKKPQTGLVSHFLHCETTILPAATPDLPFLPPTNPLPHAEAGGTASACGTIPKPLYLSAAKPTDQGEESVVLLVVVVGGLFFSFPCTVFLVCEKAKTLPQKGCEKAKTLSQKGCEKAKQCVSRCID